MTTPLLLQSRILRSPHAFTTRQGGVSPAPFASLNFGNPGDLLEGRDPTTNIAENFARVLAALDCQDRRILQVHQVQGNDIHIPTDASAQDTRADAIIVTDPRALAAVRVADCAPVLIESEDGSIVAAVHSGWRGAVAKIVRKTVIAMRELGAKNLRAAIGPCIGFENFEVGEEVLARFEQAFPGHPEILVRTHSGKGRVDLKRAIALDLQNAGVETIDTLPHCAVADPDLFYSHRRDRGITGRMIGLIGPMSQ